MSVAHWKTEPTILFHKDYILELWPLENLSQTRKINAITRMIIILAIIGLIITNSYYIVVVALIALLIIIVISKRKDEDIETFMNKGNINTETKKVALKSNFEAGTPENPYSNVMLTDINDNPEKKEAAPSYIKEVGEEIKKNVKEMILQKNPHMKAKEENKWDEYEDERANHIFYSTANTRVSNDQGAFAEFLYGNMASSKESDVNGALMRTKNNSRYTLY